MKHMGNFILKLFIEFQNKFQVRELFRQLSISYLNRKFGGFLKKFIQKNILTTKNLYITQNTNYFSFNYTLMVFIVAFFKL